MDFFDKLLERLGYGGITAVIGILIVFTGLAIIIGMLYAMAAIFRKIDKKKADKAAEAAKAAAEAAAAPAPAAAPAEEIVTEEVTDDSELIAVIAAAIAAFDGTGKKIAVKAVRRISGWKNAARTEQIYKF